MPRFKHEIIRIDDEVYERILALKDELHDTPNRALRRLFGLPVAPRASRKIKKDS